MLFYIGHFSAHAYAQHMPVKHKAPYRIPPAAVIYSPAFVVDRYFFIIVKRQTQPHLL